MSRRSFRLTIALALVAPAAACEPAPPGAPVAALAVAAGDPLPVRQGAQGAPVAPATPAPADSVVASPEEETTPRAGVPRPAPREDFTGARFPRPHNVRGLYVNAWAAGSSRRMAAILDIARETEINSLVIDIKDATGFISHRTNLELAHAIGATEEVRIADLPGLLDRLEEEGIYPIARIVIVKDPILAAYRPELAIQDTAGGVWVDSKGITWLNPYQEAVWKYHVDLAREVAEMGFPEIQWDYVRFPDAPESDEGRAVYTNAAGRERTEAIRGFLAHARSSLADLPVRTTADVFGVTTTYRRDVGIGQVWERFIDVVDVALPMVYPSHYYPGSFGYAEPNAHPYEVVKRAVEDAVRRSAAVEGAGQTRPWLQDFSLGQPIYAGAEVRAQIQATYDAGVDEWILWNPGTRYTVSALEPLSGFEQEPLVRVAGVLAPVSRRRIVIDSVAAALAEQTEARLAETSAPDSAGTPRPVPGDAEDAPAPSDTTSAGGAGGRSPAARGGGSGGGA